MGKLPATILKQFLKHSSRIAKLIDKAAGFPVSPILGPLLGGWGILFGASKSSGLKGKMKKAVQEAVDDHFAEGE